MYVRVDTCMYCCLYVLCIYMYIVPLSISVRTLYIRTCMQYICRCVSMRKKGGGSNSQIDKQEKGIERCEGRSQRVMQLVLLK